MTLRQLRSLCLLLLAIMPSGIFGRTSCAQEARRAEKPYRSATPLQPPPPNASQVSTDNSAAATQARTEQAAPLRIVLQMVPPAGKPGAPPDARRAHELAAPDRTSAAEYAATRASVADAPALTTAPAPRKTSDTMAPRKFAIELAPPKGTAAAPRAPMPPALTIAVRQHAPSEAAPRADAVSGEAVPGDAVPGEALSVGTAVLDPLSSAQTAAPAELSPATVPELQPDEIALPAPYWVADVQRLSASGRADLQPIEFDQAIWDALAHSPYVKAVMTVPQISQAKIAEATGIFDSTPFVDSIWNDTSDPVGSTLTTGGPSRLNEQRLDNAVGVRSKNALGGTAELGQNMQMRNNNSVFLSPKEQADAKLLLRLNQPLMRGAGRTYTTSSIRIAQFNAGVTEHEAMRKLQLHAQSIANAYWNLFAARAVDMQAQRGTERLVYLRDELAKRAELDGLQSQLLRAEAAIARQASIKARAQADVAAAEASLRALVNSPTLVDGPAVLMPATPPIDQPFVIDRMSELQAALEFHPDVLAARDRIKAATTRLKVAQNELRPTLNVVLEGYLHGLNGNYGLGDSMADQFSRGRPSYAGGLNYQRPYRNIVSKAILRERRLELRQLLLDLDNTLLTVTAEVDQAIAAVTATYAELDASIKSTTAFDAEVRYLDGRWQNAFVETTQPSLLLDELLNAQNQLIQSENSWARAQAEHMMAFAKLHVATGMLLNALPIPAD